MDREALRVLRDIHERGLTVTWRYLVGSPEYGDGEEMPDKDWRIISTELHDSAYIAWETVEIEDWHVIKRAVLKDAALEALK